jgi:hypothetical protein
MTGDADWSAALMNMLLKGPIDITSELHGVVVRTLNN